MGYHEPTRVQAETLEPGLAGRDLLVRSQTGTGKTCAFAVPIIERVQAGTRRTQAIVLSPTRELATQIAEEMANIARYHDLRVLCLYGGAAIGPQEQALREGAEIVVGTPGRVLDHLRRGNLDLSGAVAVCLDEADEMLSMGFYQDVTRIMKEAPREAQVLLFSATVSGDVKRLVSQFLKDPVDLLLSTDTDKVEGIRHILYEAGPHMHRVRALLALIEQEQPGTTLIFCNTREDTATVANFLDRQGLDVQLISGELPQKKRSEVMARVKSGEIQFLVATDVAARGIDISDITHVINYSLPQDPAVYMHRVGRTGRIGKTGVAISLAGGQDLATRLVLERQFKVPFEVRELPSPEEVDRLRTERLVQHLARTMKTTAFESYLPLVRHLKEREDGDLLLATALRIYFQWHRAQRAAEGPNTLGALADARREKAEGAGGQGRRRKRKRRKESGGQAPSAPASQAQGASAQGGAAKKRRRRRRRRKPAEAASG